MSEKTRPGRPLIMGTVRYVHAADLHLDVAFKGAVSQFEDASRSGRQLWEAAFTALERLVRLCEREKPDFVVLAGDIYNQEDHSLRAQFALRDACKRLEAAGIPVFVAHGNHDPLTSRLTALEWPSNVVFFGSEVEAHPVLKNGQQIALVHGISHASNAEGRNLAKLFRRDAANSCFQLGVLHCSLDDVKSDRYAPCSKSDLVSAGLDAWALGHVHKRQVVCESPLIAYSGNIQGLHINEQGPKGCNLVTAKAVEGGWDFATDFHHLGPVQWDTVEVDLSGAKTMDEVARLLENALVRARENVAPECQVLIARLVLRGDTDMDGSLHKADALQILADQASFMTSQVPAVWIKDIRLETRPAINPDNYLERDDLVGEVARICRDMAADREKFEEFAKNRLASLFDNPRLNKLLTMPQGEMLEKILGEAERICLERLEKS